MKELLLVGLLLNSCGVPRTPIAASEMETLLMQGHSLHMPATEPLESLQLSSSSEGIFQISRFIDHPEVGYRVSFDSKLMPALDESALTEACFSYATRQLNISSQNLATLIHDRDIQVSDNIRASIFRRKVGSINVQGAFLDCRFAKFHDHWKLHSIINNTFFHYPTALNLPLTADDLGQIFDQDNPATVKGRALLPIAGELRSTTIVDYKYDKADTTIYLDNLTGQPLKAHYHDLHASRILMGEAYRRGYRDSETFQTILPLTPITFPSGNEVSSVEGRFFTQEEASSLELNSQRVRLFHKDSSEPMIVYNFSNFDNLIRVESQSDGLVAINTYAAVHRINKFVRQYISPEVLPFLDYPLEVRVNLDGSCNAYYTTGKKVISLFSAGDGCANIGEVNDVIYHEWGHALDEHTGRNIGVQDGAFSEGLADFLAALYNEDPRIGIGFVQDADYGIRSLENLLTYPEDIGEVHREGGIIAGAFWDLYKELEEVYGLSRGKSMVAELFFGHLVITDTYLESYENVLLLDDNDGNPATPSPHKCAINRAFARHGLATPLNCTDEAVDLPAADSDLNLALYNLDDRLISVVGSSREMERFSICMGTRAQCLNGDRIHLELPYLTENEERKFYAFQGPLALKGVDFVTLILKNPQGRVMGSRLVKIVTN